jgi:hypothetical protein
MNDKPRTADPEGVNPTGQGPAQPRDNDHDQVPTERDREHLTSEEHGELSEIIEHERDA